MKGKRLVSLALVAVLLTGITSGVCPALSTRSPIEVSSVNIDKEACISYIVKAQNPDGGFPFYLGEKSNLAGTCHALMGLDAVGALDKIDRGACLKWIMQFQNPAGGFSPSLEEDPNLWFTGLAVMSLVFLDALNEMNEDSCIKFIQSCQNPEGGFALMPGGTPNLMVTGLAVWTLHDMGKIEKIDQDSCRDFIVGCECPAGGFGVQPSGLMSGFPMLPSSGFAVLSLNWLEGLDRIDKDSCANYIASCQERDGSFSITSSPFMNEFMTCMMPMMPKLLTACPMMEKLPMMDMMTLMGGGGGMPPSAFNYSGVFSLEILNALERMNLDVFIDFICQCQNPDGGFGGKLGTKSTTVDSGHSLAMLKDLGVL